jgi:hypothetical protein
MSKAIYEATNILEVPVLPIEKGLFFGFNEVVDLLKMPRSLTQSSQRCYANNKKGQPWVDLLK